MTSHKIGTREQWADAREELLAREKEHTRLGDELARQWRELPWVRHRTKVTKGPGSRAAGLAMAFKLIESAQDRWRAVNAPHLVALVRAGATFINGKLVERPGEEAQPEAA